MAGQAALKSREEVRSAIRKVETSNANTGKGPKMSVGSMKTTNRK